MTKYERFVRWLNKFYHVQNKITICVLYTLIMAILGVLIYGATHQQANSSISVKYTVPSYTVTFDPNGGELSTTGGGVSSKIVKLGDTYGDLPVPTRTGYSFVGWRGRNMLNSFNLLPGNENADFIAEYQVYDGIYFKGTVPSPYYCSERISLLSYFEVGKTYFLYTNSRSGILEIRIDYTDGTYAFSRSSYTVKGNETSVFLYFTYTAGLEVDEYVCFMLEEGERTEYQPYFLNCYDKYVDKQNSTLYAEWIENSKNLFTNGDFENVYTQTDTGWDNSLNGTLRAWGWGDYNGDVDSPGTGYHAHIKDLSATDSLHKHVYEYHAVNTRWLGINQIINISNGMFMFTAQVYRVSGANQMRAAAWYSRASDGVNTHGSTNRIFLEEMVQGEWVTVRSYFTIDDNMNSRFEYYFYGSESGVGIFYLDNVFLTQIS